AILPAQGRAEWAPLLERIELLYVVLVAKSVHLVQKAAGAVLIPRVGIGAVDAAEIRRPVRRFRAHAPFDVAVPARRAGSTSLRMNENHAGLGSGAVHRGGSRARQDLNRLDIVGIQAVQPERAEGDGPPIHIPSPEPV